MATKRNKHDSQRFADNKAAFDAIIGNTEEPGQYVLSRVRNTIIAVQYNDGSATTRNPAAPSKADFCVDVDRAILAAIKSKKLLKKFVEHYIIGKDVLSQAQQNGLEQQVGEKFRRRKIYPVGQYFTTIRRKPV